MYPYVYEITYMNVLDHESVSECGMGLRKVFRMPFVTSRTTRKKIF